MENVELKNNVNLKYLKGLVGHPISRVFYLSGCTSLLNSEVALVADQYNGCQSYAKNIEEKYKKYLASESVLIYNDCGLTDSSDDVKYLLELSKAKRDKVLAIRLQNNPNLGNDKINDILKGFKNIVCINVNGCTKLTSLEFIKSTPAVKELLFKDTGVTDVALLDTYATNLRSIECNNSGIQLTTMQQTLSRLRRVGIANAFHSDAGMRIYDLASQLGNCTDLTSIELTGLDYTGTIDLHGLTKNYVYIGYRDAGNYTLILPPNISEIRVTNWTCPDFSYVNKIQRLTHENGNIELLAEICMWIDKFDIQLDIFIWTYPKVNANTVIAYKNVENNFNVNQNYKISDVLNKLTGCGLQRLYLACFFNSGGSFDPVSSGNNYIRSGNLDTLDFSEGFENLKMFCAFNCVIEDLDFLSNCSNLEKIFVKSATLGDISGISGLTKLTKLDFYDNAIKDVTMLGNLKSLQELNLEDNILIDRVNNISNLATLASLHTSNGGALTKIYLRGNDGITSFNDVSGLSWSSKSGF